MGLEWAGPDSVASNRAGDPAAALAASRRALDRDSDPAALGLVAAADLAAVGLDRLRRLARHSILRLGRDHRLICRRGRAPISGQVRMAQDRMDLRRPMPRTAHTRTNSLYLYDKMENVTGYGNHPVAGFSFERSLLLHINCLSVVYQYTDELK